MEVRATAKYVRVQPRKVRIVADEVRGKDAGHAAALLFHHTSKGAKSLRKVLISAMANAAENHGIAPETLKIATIMVDEGPHLKRMTAKAMGRGARILKKTSHITVVVEEFAPKQAVRPHGTKPKRRPTFQPSQQTQKIAPKWPIEPSQPQVRGKRMVNVRFRSALERTLVRNERAEILVNVGPEGRMSLDRIVPAGTKANAKPIDEGVPVIVTVNAPHCEFEFSSAELVVPSQGESKVLSFGFVPGKSGAINLDVVMIRKDSLGLLQHVVVTENVVEGRR